MYIIVGIITAGFIFLVIMLMTYDKRNIRNETKDWKIGDKIVLLRNNENKSILNDLSEINLKYAILSGWDGKHVFLKIGEYHYEVKWERVECNVSAKWRRNYENCKKYMGVEPNIPNVVSDGNSSIPSNSRKVDGKDISLLSETECEVQLKIAIEKEDYELADLLRKRLEHFK